VKSGATLPTPFLDIDAKVRSGGERGLLSMAFHPDYESNGRFFVNYTREPDGATVVSRFDVSGNPDVANGASEKILLTISQPFTNHNGGQIAFGPDGRLYVGMGDGGAGGDPNDVSQSDSSLLGKMLRLNVDVDSAPYHSVPPDNPNAGAGLPLGLIWAKGLRNPWRFSFDRANGDLYIGDVGQNAVEEIDYTVAASTGGENYGWDDMEGSSCYEPASGCLTAGRVLPIVEYSHAQGCSVTGGHVYRGCALPSLSGTYFYSDYCTSFVRTFEVAAGVATNPADRSAQVGTGGNISSYGEDARGEIHIVNLGGEVYRIVPAP
jgi:glucose/arabinose dehydrogenase